MSIMSRITNCFMLLKVYHKFVQGSISNFKILESKMKKKKNLKLKRYIKRSASSTHKF
jgi:hypothetical protein